MNIKSELYKIQNGGLKLKTRPIYIKFDM